MFYTFERYVFSKTLFLISLSSSFIELWKEGMKLEVVGNEVDAYAQHTRLVCAIL